MSQSRRSVAGRSSVEARAVPAELVAGAWTERRPVAAKSWGSERTESDGHPLLLRKRVTDGCTGSGRRWLARVQLSVRELVEDVERRRWGVSGSFVERSRLNLLRIHGCASALLLLGCLGCLDRTDYQRRK